MSIAAWSEGMGVFATLPGADAVLDLGLKECLLHKLNLHVLKREEKWWSHENSICEIMG